MTRHFRTTIAVAVGAALVLVVGLSSVALAQGGPGGRRGFFGPGRGFGPGGGLALGRLDLTDAQRDQVRDVMQRHRDEMQEAGRRLRAAHEGQREAIETFPVNEALIRSTSQALAAAQTDMALLQARIQSEIFSLLTPEQQAKAKELRERRQPRRRR